MHYFFGPQKSWDTFFPRAKNAADQARVKMGDRFPDFALPDNLTVNDQQLITWVLLLYHVGGNNAAPGLNAEWLYAKRGNAGASAVDDGVELAACVAIGEIVNGNAVDLETWPMQPPYPDFDIRAFFSMTFQPDRLDRPRDKYWNDSSFPFPGLFYARLGSNLFDASANVIESLLVAPPLITVDVEARTAMLNGRPIALKSPEVATFLKFIVDAGPNWISTTEMQKDPLLCDRPHLPRLKQEIPDLIEPHIESQQGKGYRWRAEKSAR